MTIQLTEDQVNSLHRELAKTGTTAGLRDELQHLIDAVASDTETIHVYASGGRRFGMGGTGRRQLNDLEAVSMNPANMSAVVHVLDEKTHLSGFDPVEGQLAIIINKNRTRTKNTYTSTVAVSSSTATFGASGSKLLFDAEGDARVLFGAATDKWYQVYKVENIRPYRHPASARGQNPVN